MMFFVQRGYIETLLGRRRYLPGINSGESDKASYAQRQAVNSVCQGSAADLIKLAMINIHRRVEKELRSQKLCRLVLQVHDELVFEVSQEVLGHAVAIVKDCMQRAVRLQVPLQVQVKKGPTWGDLQPVQRPMIESCLNQHILT